MQYSEVTTEYPSRVYGIKYYVNFDCVPNSIEISQGKNKIRIPIMRSRDFRGDVRRIEDNILKQIEDRGLHLQ